MRRKRGEINKSGRYGDPRKEKVGGK